MRNRHRVATALLGLAGSIVGLGADAADPDTAAAYAEPVDRSNAAAVGATVSNVVRGPSLASIRDVVDVTAMSTAFEAVDQNGLLVRDLRADEVAVFEDGSQARLLSLDQRHPAPGPEASGEDLESAMGRVDDQRVVVYVSAGLGNRALLRAVSQQIDEESTRLTKLGPVDVVVRTRDAISRERALIHDALEEMVMWLQNQPPEAGGVLIWITRGFDLDPASRSAAAATAPPPGRSVV